MISSDQILEDAARDGSIDISEWPRVLESMLQKLHDIVHNAFPVPAIPVLPPGVDRDVVASTPSPSHRHDEEHGSRDPDADEEMQENDADDNDDENQPPSNSQSSTKENEAPSDSTLTPRTPSRPPVPGFNDTPHQLAQPSSASIAGEPGAIPPDLLSLYQATTHVLQRDFAHSPPYTIQRLAEMVLYPRKHYRFLPAYLRALDRIVSVSSPVSDFPLPTLNATTNGSSFLTNGDNNMANGSNDKDGLGSDESLGGALLTPIPWLRNNGGTFAGPGTSASQQEGELHSKSTETIEGPNGAGSIETVTVTVNGVPSATTVAHTSDLSTPASPTLSEQSDASSTTSSPESTDAQLRQQGGVTQGELLRQEQEAGVVPASQPTHRRPIATHSPAAVGREAPTASTTFTTATEPEGDHPHARGPEEVGMEDMGPQSQNSSHHGALDMEAAVGRARSPPSSQQPQQQQSAPPAIPSSEDAPTNASNTSSASASVFPLATTTDDAGDPAAAPKDVEMEITRLREALDEQTAREARDADGDVVVADAAGEKVEMKMEM